jgi:phage baseplate assembly protein W
MVLQISRAFRDISLSFTKNPVTNDIIPLRNEDAIKRAVVNLVRTRIGERFFNSLLGTNIEASLFELNLSENTSYLKSEIEVLLENFEPRVKVRNIGVQNVEDSNELNVRISYDIIGLSFPQQNIEFILVPARI